MNNFNKIIKLLDDKKVELPIMVLFFLFVGLIDLLTLYLIQPLISTFTGSANTYLAIQFIEHNFNLKLHVMSLSILLIFAFLVKFFGALYLNFVILRFAQTHQSYVRLKLFKIIANKSYSEFQKTQITDYVQAIQVLAQQYTNNILTPVIRSLSDLIIGVMVLGYLIYLSWKITMMIVTIFLLAYLFYTAFFKSRMTQYGEASTQAASDITALTTESFSGFRELTVFSSWSKIQTSLQKYCDDYGQNFLKYSLISTMPRYYFELVFSLLIGLIILYFFVMGIPSSEGFEFLAVLVVASMRLLPSMHQMSNLNLLLKFNANCMDRLLSLWDHSSSSQILDLKARRIEVNDLKIKLQNVSLWRNKKVFDNVSYEFGLGEHVAIVGTSGIGKSSLLDVIMGFVQSKSGTVAHTINGVKLDPFDFWPYCAFISQHTTIFSGSLKDNLTMFSDDEDFDHDRANGAIRFAQLDDLFVDGKENYDFLIEQFGSNLSGGQKQRLSWARAFYSNASVIVIDEGTSALDEATETKILDGLSRDLSDRLIIFVTHKPERLKYFDNIIELTSDGLRLVAHV